MSKKRLVIFTDTWKPEDNYTVGTIQKLIETIEKKELTVTILGPNTFKNYSLKRLLIPNTKLIRKRLWMYRPDYIHIASAGPIGVTAAKILKQRRIPYTTSFHTYFPEYYCNKIPFIRDHEMHKIFIDKIYDNAHKTLVSTDTERQQLMLEGENPDNVKIIGRGVDRERLMWKGYKNLGKNLLYVGKISKKRNLESLLSIVCLTPFSLNLVGDGPDLKRLKRRYEHFENITFSGPKNYIDLPIQYRKSDILVCPFRGFTTGAIQLEAIASGLPVATLDNSVTEKLISPGVNGYACRSIHTALHKCAGLSSMACSESINHLTWDDVSDRFVDNLIETRTTNW